MTRSIAGLAVWMKLPAECENHSGCMEMVAGGEPRPLALSQTHNCVNPPGTKKKDNSHRRESDCCLSSSSGPAPPMSDGASAWSPTATVNTVTATGRQNASGGGRQTQRSGDSVRAAEMKPPPCRWGLKATRARRREADAPPASCERAGADVSQ